MLDLTQDTIQVPTSQQTLDWLMSLPNDYEFGRTERGRGWGQVCLLGRYLNERYADRHLSVGYGSISEDGDKVADTPPELKSLIILFDSMSDEDCVWEAQEVRDYFARYWLACMINAVAYDY